MKQQSLVDPCRFYKHIETGQTILIVVCFVNNMLLVGTKEQVEWLKRGIEKRFSYSDLVKLQKHLGIWYKEKLDENGERDLKAMRPNAPNTVPIPQSSPNMGTPSKWLTQSIPRLSYKKPTSPPSRRLSAPSFTMLVPSTAP